MPNTLIQDGDFEQSSGAWTTSGAGVSFLEESATAGNHYSQLKPSTSLIQSVPSLSGGITYQISLMSRGNNSGTISISGTETVPVGAVNSAKIDDGQWHQEFYNITLSASFGNGGAVVFEADYNADDTVYLQLDNLTMVNSTV